MSKWNSRWLGLAYHYASFSEDESTKVGAVIVGDGDVQLSEAWNGLPRGVKNTPERNERPAKYLYYAHAERNAIDNASRKGVSLLDATIYVTHFPCSDCAKGIIQSGISRVFYAETIDNGNWNEHNAASSEMLGEAGVEVKQFTATGQWCIA